MADGENEDSRYLSGRDMREWLKQEIADITKATELRTAEASRFVEAYARSEIPEEELANRMQEYSNRWGDPLPGVTRSEGLTDGQILTKIDKFRRDEDRLEATRTSGIRRGL